MHPFIPFLQQKLLQSLPGQQSQLKMAPKPVTEGKVRRMNPVPDAHPSSVLVLLFPNQKQLELVLTLRTSNIDHGGQISFPGGRAESGETEIETALREAREEIGIPLDDVSIIGTLSQLFVNHSNNSVTPVVGYIAQRPAFSKNPEEVEEVFTVSLEELADEHNLIHENWHLGEHKYEVPYWNVHHIPLWGATAMMLSELLDLYKAFKSQ